MEPGNDVTVLADEALVGKILDNLLNNAMMYADHPPTIRVAARKEGQQVSLTVADDGIGISPEDQGRIFARFARGTDPMVREKPGTGLGLYLSRGLAEQMGGSLKLQSSQPGKGSTFVLRLPDAGS
jgi:signal transduction histidine kinase